jgi:proprotein convertase subtilisin/kexin type 5
MGSYDGTVSSNQKYLIGAKHLLVIKDDGSLFFENDFTSITGSNWIADYTNMPNSITMINAFGTITKGEPAGCIPACHSTCKTCDGPTETDCLSCHPWSVYNSGLKSCEIPCHGNCETCFGTAVNQCMTCAAPLVISTESRCCHASCLTCYDIIDEACVTCHPGFFLGTLNDMCEGCDASCVTCSGSANNQCLTCPSTSFLNGSNECEACHSSCDTCNGASDSDCLTCEESTFLNGSN